MKRGCDAEFASSEVWHGSSRKAPGTGETRQTWCVDHKGERIPLGSDRDEAFRQYHAIMAKPDQECHPVRWGLLLPGLMIS
jgi:hypothetical protein